MKLSGDLRATKIRGKLVWSLVLDSGELGKLRQFVWAKEVRGRRGGDEFVLPVFVGLEGFS